MLQIVLNERPAAGIVPETFREVEVDAPVEDDLQPGEVLFETYYLSIDPSNRICLKDTRSYMPPVQIGHVMIGLALGKILASRNQQFNPGDWATGMSGWREVAILGPGKVFPTARCPDVELTCLLGVLSFTGLTAYFGIRDIAEPRPGDLVVVSGAAGATGSVVGQICKMKGARVVGIAGTDDKCRWLTDDLGFDAALNYKATDFRTNFLEATKSLIDVYWDNVGGEILDLALLQAKEHARFVMCGISGYNSSAGDIYHLLTGGQNIGKIIQMRIRLQGFLVLDYKKELGSATVELAKWISEGKLKSRSTVIKGGLRLAPQALDDLFRGVNTGKLMVEVKSPEEGL